MNLEHAQTAMKIILHAGDAREKTMDALKALDTFDIENAKDNIMIKDNYVYLCSPYMPGQKGLRIMRTGLLLGELKKNRFEPSQALAMVLKISDYPDVINLPASDERVIKYLKGETLDLPEFDGKTENFILRENKG